MTLARPLVFGSLLLLLGGIANAGPAFRVAVAEDGYYGLAYEQLKLAGQTLPSHSLGLFERNQPVPIRVNDGGDGVFGPGDSIAFTGRRLAGAASWYDHYSAYNIYQLRTDEPPGAHAGAPLESVSTGAVIHHIEHDLVRVALPHAPQTPAAETWYWRRLSHLEQERFSHDVVFDAPPRALRVALAGLSRDRNAAAAGLPQHEVVVRLNEQTIGRESWDGQESVILAVTDPTVLQSAQGSARLEILVPRRKVGADNLDLIDAVLLNWIEVEYPPGSDVTGDVIPDRSGSYQLVVPLEVRAPDWVESIETGPDLRAAEQQADYLMISHPSLTEALQPLASYHREQGLNVRVIETQAIYDQFNFGIKSPKAIRDFISHAWRNWRAPAPRFVLLAGDASWARNPSPGDNRDLVPTFHVQTLGALAASDNGLVTVDGEDWRPDLAIGRLPAGSARALTDMVAKILRYARSAPEGDWRNTTTWIADIDKDFQQATRELSNQVRAAGFNAREIFPDGEKRGSADDQSRVLDAFNESSVLLHFLGHGGRFVWRTGPEDLARASDLFGLEGIQSLEENAALPLVLSMTCSSGPFDHPFADSMAEALLSATGRGAVGVVAASWRVPASRRFSSLLAETLLDGNNTIGEAVMRAKQRERRRSLVESYNLLGDPALRLAGQLQP